MLFERKRFSLICVFLKHFTYRSFSLLSSNLPQQSPLTVSRPYIPPLSTAIVDYVTTSSHSQFIRTLYCVNFNLRKETGRARKASSNKTSNAL